MRTPLRLVPFGVLLVACPQPSAPTGAPMVIPQGSDAGASAAPSSSGTRVALRGSGSSVLAPSLASWIVAYRETHPAVDIVYEANGNGAGVKAMSDDEADFALLDLPPSDFTFPRGAVFVPLCTTAIAIVYNLPGIGALALDRATLAKIFRGKVSRWNDSAIAATNPAAALPPASIEVAWRSDGSAATRVFTEMLSAVDFDFKQDVGVGTTVAWPTGIGVVRSKGIADYVVTVPNAIAYVELPQALASGLPIAAIGNRGGAFVKPTVDALARAAESAKSDDDDARFVDAPGTGAYPIMYVVQAVARAASRDRPTGAALGDFLAWFVSGGPTFGPSSGYAPLPPALAKIAASRAARLNGGKGVAPASEPPRSR